MKQTKEISEVQYRRLGGTERIYLSIYIYNYFTVTLLTSQRSVNYVVFIIVDLVTSTSLNQNEKCQFL